MHSRPYFRSRLLTALAPDSTSRQRASGVAEDGQRGEPQLVPREWCSHPHPIPNGTQVAYAIAPGMVEARYLSKDKACDGNTDVDQGVNLEAIS